MADSKQVRERKKKSTEGDKEDSKEEKKKVEDEKETDAKPKDTTKTPPKENSKSKQKGGLNPCVVLVGLLMLVSGVYLTWINIGGTGEIEGTIEGGRLATSLKAWPRRVLEHHSAGVYVPINDGHQSYNLFARSEGNSRKENEVVLLLHGVPVSSYVYRKMLPHLNEAGLYAVAFDFPGTGLSDKPQKPSYDWHYLAESVKSLIESMDLGSVHLVLHDIAGPIGLEFAIRYPTLVRSITFANSLINPEGHQPPFPMSTFTMDYAKHVTFWLSTCSWPVVSHLGALNFRLQAASSISHEDYLAHAFLLKYNRGKDSFFKIMNGFDTSAKHAEFLTKGLKNLMEERNVSVQAVWVTDDIMTRSEEHKNYLTSNYALKHVHTLPSKHFIQEDQPEEFAKHIIRFVKEQSPTLSKLRNKREREAAELHYAHRDDHGHTASMGMADDLLSFGAGHHGHGHGHGHGGHHEHGAGCSHH